MRTRYGLLTNRVMEDKEFSAIEVGTPVTEYFYSDRRVYEVVGVIDEKHVEVRAMRAIPDGLPMSNQWKLESDADGYVKKLTKRGKYWYWTHEVTKEDYEEGLKEDEFYEVRLRCAGYDPEIIMRRGKQMKYSRAHVSFGVADYYYDYEF